ncbi:MAG: hypothetical protein EBR05_11850 [Marivivens sp.]|nr:hypothetical protein [Marivivens sp.]
MTKRIAVAGAGLNCAKALGFPLLTAHHQRNNPSIQKAVEIVKSGELGHITTLQTQTCGAISSVQMMESNAVRGNKVEETAVVLLR